MGLKIDRERFADEDYERFAERLERSLQALRELLERPGFGQGPASLGAELELFLIDPGGRPLPLNRAVLRETVDPRLTVELDRFNLECNLRWSPLAGRPFTALAHEMEEAVTEVRRAAGTYRGRVAMIGILPTLREDDLQRHAMTDIPRYRALSAGLQRLRRGPFRVSIDGAEPLDVTCDDVTFEGANTSLQLHLRVAPDRFADVYNGIQLASAPALAVAANSPTFLGHRLWEETRVALFKQAVDDRGPGRSRVARVGFGTGWASRGAWELFAESVALHEPLLPVLGGEDPLECVRGGGVPALDEMRLHQGTIWNWTRAIYDPASGGHLRVEMRGLPAGPTIRDMLANTALLVGAGLGIAEDADHWLREVPFEIAEHNFYRAAQSGLDAEILWPREPGAVATPVRAAELVRQLLPVARRGLAGAGVDTEESEPLLELLERRVATGQTGARWQRESLASFEPRRGRARGLAAMLESYLARSEEGRPVHEWSLDTPRGRVRAAMAPRGSEVPSTPVELLRQLGGAALLRVPGRDRTRTRVVSTLLHGNEPSGLSAVHAYLRSADTPEVDVVFLLGGVAAALEPPGFAHRQLPGGRDLNRCFLPPYAGPEGALARELLELLDEVAPEALVDLHNNTGHSPPYGVVPRAGGVERSLVAFFAQRYVHSDLRLGALVEAAAPRFPSAVVECGRAGDPEADAVAQRGLVALLSSRELERRQLPPLTVAVDPVRVRVRAGLRLAVGDGPEPGADLTLAREIDRHNFEQLEQGHRIGWLGPGAGWPLEAVGAAGTDVSRHLFAARDGQLVTRTALVPIMMTTDPHIAASDCLFYVVREESGQEP